MHTKLKCMNIFSVGFLVGFTKIYTYENFLLYSTRDELVN